MALAVQGAQALEDRRRQASTGQLLADILQRRIAASVTDRGGEILALRAQRVCHRSGAGIVRRCVAVVVLLRDASHGSQRVPAQVRGRAADTLRVGFRWHACRGAGHDSTRRVRNRRGHRNERAVEAGRLQQAQAVFGERRADGVQHFGQIGVLRFEMRVCRVLAGVLDFGLSLGERREQFRCCFAGVHLRPLRGKRRARGGSLLDAGQPGRHG